MEPIVKVISGQNAGPRLAVFCGVHGNERAGIMVVDKLSSELHLEKGEVAFVYANPLAIDKNVRFVHQNLNRLFIRANPNTSYENEIAERLMNLLDTCDALLDLHSYNEPNHKSTPFVICEREVHELAKKFPVAHVVSGFTKMEPGGTDGYMHLRGKVGICAELGAIEAPIEYVDLGLEVVQVFLEHYGLLRSNKKRAVSAQTHSAGYYMHKRQSEKFSFTKEYKTFDHVAKGEVVAVDGDVTISAPKDSMIMFPRDCYPVGVEAFVLSEYV